jgi:hypothetical protein
LRHPERCLQQYRRALRLERDTQPVVTRGSAPIG